MNDKEYKVIELNKENEIIDIGEIERKWMQADLRNLIECKVFLDNSIEIVEMKGGFTDSTFAYFSIIRDRLKYLCDKWIYEKEKNNG